MELSSISQCPMSELDTIHLSIPLKKTSPPWPINNNKQLKTTGNTILRELLILQPVSLPLPLKLLPFSVILSSGPSSILALSLSSLSSCSARLTFGSWRISLEGCWWVWDGGARWIKMAKKAGDFRILTIQLTLIWSIVLSSGQVRLLEQLSGDCSSSLKYWLLASSG